EKAKILAQCRQRGVSITALREQVLDIVLAMSGVVKAYQVLACMQQASGAAVAPPTAYRALDFWAEQGVLHKVSAVNGYILCRHVQHECSVHCHEEAAHHHSAFVLVCTECGAVDEQSLSLQWAALQQGLAQTGFALNDEHIVLTGICQKCQQHKQSISQ
ncbi:Fur family transcriptional regulator, partial [Snodgrassella sp. CFCC 13594]|uniref:Fur family transcriptional regulator n=1 Tax=Snodgrassella sp. CFCC 13594 TaxID=1775559 RepID=UPI00082A0379